MHYLLCCDTLPEIGVMPVIKTTEYPLSPYGTGPLCYLRLAYTKGLGVMVDLMNFERDPLLDEGGDIAAGSACWAVFDFAPQNGASPIFTGFRSDGKGGIFAGDGSFVRALPAATYGGVDEQGWYWGVRFYLSNQLLQQQFGIDGIRPGHKFLAAAYKTLPGEGGHFGAIAPVKETSVFCPSNLAEFTAIIY